MLSDLLCLYCIFHPLEGHSAEHKYKTHADLYINVCDSFMLVPDLLQKESDRCELSQSLRINIYHKILINYMRLAQFFSQCKSLTLFEAFLQKKMDHLFSLVWSGSCMSCVIA